jgi:DNA-nicking Smr family endonuclease
MCGIAKIYGLRLTDVQECAKNANIRPFNGGAQVSPAEQEKMRPELERRARKQELRKSNVKKERPIVYQTSDDYSDFTNDGDQARFTREEMSRHLNPQLQRRDRAAGDER